FMILTGSYHSGPLLIIIATVGLVVASVSSLEMNQRAYYGPATSETPLRGMSAREFLMIMVLVLLLVLLGVYPQPILDNSHDAM
ncbi:NADH-quinone oxidoreductase subunit M, partial [Erwinia amylovora]|nr:NADH-quinone oxidoreductase subunit M [Erwinia amylovora]